MGNYLHSSKRNVTKAVANLSCICLFNKDLLSVYDMPGTVLSTGAQL